MAESNRELRWGIVGTGVIAGAMAPMIQMASGAKLVAVASRELERASAFAKRHGIARCFDSWAQLAAWDGVDAIYVATPTSTREAICTAVAASRKHVLGEKPFASLPSLRRIGAACRDNGVGFMDATHFVHHPRCARIRDEMPRQVGRARSVDSAFLAGIGDPDNIRFNPELEPMGAIGDLGWYNMRAAVEFLAPGVGVNSVAAYLRRDGASGAVIGGIGTVLFDDGSTTTWRCAFDCGALNMDLRISGPNGIVLVDDFVGNRSGQPASYRYRKDGFDGVCETFEVPSAKPAAALMFEDFAAMVGDPDKREESIVQSERTQALLDASWCAARASERG